MPHTPRTPEEEAEFTRRSGELSSRLERLNSERSARQAKESEKPATGRDGGKNGLALALRMSTEFVAGVAVGAAFGYAIDWYFGTSPWGIIIFLMLGFCAAVLNVLRSAGLVAESGMRVDKARQAAEKREFGPPSGKR